jgi:hypothetical protein
MSRRWRSTAPASRGSTRGRAVRAFLVFTRAARAEELDAVAMEEAVASL